MALCLTDEQMLQLTFHPLFLSREGVLKTLAYSQQNLVATAKLKSPPHLVLNIAVGDNRPLMLYYSQLI